MKTFRACSLKFFRRCPMIFFAALTARAQVPQLIAYQGRLLTGSNLVSGVTPISLRLFNAATNGMLLYEDSNNVAVADGLYSTFLGDATTSGSLTNALTASNLFLEVAVNGAALSPRERVASVAYALTAGTAQGVPANTITSQMIAPGTIAPVNLSMASFATTFWETAGNAGTTPGLHFVGTTDGQPLEFRAGNLRALRLEPGVANPNMIGGASNNSAATNVSGAAIGGGAANRVLANYATISGGLGNTVTNTGAVIGGGFTNLACNQAAFVGSGFANTANGYGSFIGSGQQNSTALLATDGAVVGGSQNSADTQYAFEGGGNNNHAYGNYSVVGGGQGNVATGNFSSVLGGSGNNAAGLYSAIACGVQNYTLGYASFIAGGQSNTTLGQNAFIAGGSQNTASSFDSFAGGTFAVASHPGTFVWADSSGTQLGSTNADSWTVRASGGVRFFSGASGTNGVILPPNASSWASLSDRYAKSGFAPVDTHAILEKLHEMPVTSWHYKDDPDARN